MAIIELNLNPSKRDLRIFAGLLFPAFFGIVGGIVVYVSGSLQNALMIWAPALLLGAAAFLFPKFGRLLYAGWMRALYPIGWAVSHLVLRTIYYAAVTPLGWLARSVREDRLTRELDPSATSYWVDYRPGEEPDSYFRQF